MWAVGIPVGAFVGALSGVIFLLILRTGFEGTSLKHVTALIGELTALASFSLGGSWLAKGVLEDVGHADFLSPYILAFAVTFFIIVSKALYRAVTRLGNQIGQQKEAKP